MITIMSEPLFDTLLADAGPVRTVAAGAHLFERDAQVRALYLVEHGEVHLCRMAEDGGRVILQRARAGQIVAEASVFSDRYHCAAVAVVETELRPVPIAQVRAWIGRSPAVAEAFVRHMGRELRHARMRAEILALKTVRARLAAWREWQGGTLPARGNWRHLAEELSVSPEALYREIARVRRQGELQ